MGRADQKLKDLYKNKKGKLAGPGAWKAFPLFQFVFFLTYRCTRRCEYCYTMNQLPDLKPDMDDRTFARLLEWIPEVYEKTGINVHVAAFLGGEPLLRTDRIKTILEHVNDVTDGITGSIFSNADLVDSVEWGDLEYIQWFNFHITDLPIAEIERRQKIIRERSNAFNQTLVVTMDDFNLSRIEDVVRHAIENGHRMRIYRSQFQLLDKPYLARLAGAYHRVCDLLEQYAVKGYEIPVSFVFDALIPVWEEDITPYGCGHRIVCIHPDGSIGPCIRNHSHRVGTIYDENPLGRIRCREFRWDFRRPDLPDECRHCEVKKSCQGGCPNDRILNTGTSAGKSLMCGIHREIIPRLRKINEHNMMHSTRG